MFPRHLRHTAPFFKVKWTRKTTMISFEMPVLAQGLAVVFILPIQVSPTIIIPDKSVICGGGDGYVIAWKFFNPRPSSTESQRMSHGRSCDPQTHGKGYKAERYYNSSCL